MFYEPHVILVGSNWIFMGWCGAVSQWRPCLSLAVNMCKCTPSPRDIIIVILLVFFQVLRKVRWRLSKFIQEWLTKVVLSWWIVTIPAADVGIYRGTKALSVKLYIDIAPLGPPKGSLAKESSKKMAFRLMRSWNSLRIVYYFSMHQIILLYLFNCEAYNYKKLPTPVHVLAQAPDPSTCKDSLQQVWVDSKTLHVQKLHLDVKTR